MAESDLVGGPEAALYWGGQRMPERVMSETRLNEKEKQLWEGSSFKAKGLSGSEQPMLSDREKAGMAGAVVSPWQLSW